MKRVCIFAIQHSSSGDLRLNNYIHSLSKKYKVLVVRNDYGYSEAIKKIKQFKPDVCHLHDIKSYVLFYVFIRNSKIKYIVDYHEYYHMKEYIKTFPPIARVILKIYNLFFKKRIDKNAECVIGAVDGITEDVKNKTETIYNFPLLNKRKIINKPKVLNLCYVGRVCESKGVNQIYEIFNILKQEHKDITLHMIGAVDENFKILKCKNIKYYGRIKTKDVKKITDKCHFGFVFLPATGQHDYALPIKVFEYFASGLVVVSSSLYYLMKFIGYYKNITYSSNVQDVSKFIKYTFKDKNHYESCSELSYKLYRYNYNWESEEKKLYKIYGGVFN